MQCLFNQAGNAPSLPDLPIPTHDIGSRGPYVSPGTYKVTLDVDVGQVQEARGRVPSLQHDRPFQIAHASAMRTKAAS